MDEIDGLLSEVADLSAVLDEGASAGLLPSKVDAARTLVREALELVVRARRNPERDVFRERAAQAVRIAREAVQAARPTPRWAWLRDRPS